MQVGFSITLKIAFNCLSNKPIDYAFFRARIRLNTEEYRNMLDYHKTGNGLVISGRFNDGNFKRIL